MMLSHRMLMAAGRRTGQAGDPFAAGVVSHLHFDGANGSAAFIDEKGKMWGGAAGSWELNTTTKKFGTASLHNLTTAAGTQGLLTAATTDFAFGTGDFTIEMSVRQEAIGDHQSYADFRGSTSDGVSIYKQLDGTLRVLLDGVDRIIAGIVPNDVFRALSLTRQGNTFRLFVDGQIVGTYTGTHNFSVAKPCEIGNFTAGRVSPLNGYVDEFRVTKGIARYVANYTPATDAFPNPTIDPLGYSRYMIAVHETFAGDAAAFQEVQLLDTNHTTDFMDGLLASAFTASSYYPPNNNTPDKINDGSFDGIYGGWISQLPATLPQFVQVNMSLKKIVKSARIWALNHSFATTRSPKSLSIYGGDDGLNWVRIGASTVEPVWQELASREFATAYDTTPNTPDPDGYLQYRINITAINGDTYAAMQEVELLNSSQTVDFMDGVPNLSFFASSYYGINDNTPQKINDGNLSGFTYGAWVSNGTAGPWIVGTTLAQKSKVAHVKIWPQNHAVGPGRAPKDFKIQGSNGGGFWFDVATVTGSTGWQAGVPRTFPTIFA